MAFNRISPRTVSALPLIAVGLALANWYTKPAAAWAWAAVIVMSVVMIAVQRFWQLALSRSPAHAALTRSADDITRGVAFGALMMVVPLAATLAHAYGVVGDPRNGMGRTIMIMSGGYLAVTGNAMPRMLPPTSSMPCGGARVQAFQRFAGWTFVLCGLGIALVGLVLPIGAAAPISMALVATAVVVTIAQLVRLCKSWPHAPRLN